MRVHSRELFVGFLLVLGLAVGACQTVPPVSEISVTPTSEIIVETLPVTESVSLSETATISAGVPITEGGTDTSPVTTTMEVTETTEVSATGESTVVEPSAAADPALMVAGLAVYRAQYCGVCHSLTAAETRGTFGPPHDGMANIAAGHLADGTYHGAATTPAEYIRESIVDPQVYMVPGYATTAHRMPSYVHLDAASLDALVAFLLAH